jgi:hypothetical protein
VVVVMMIGVKFIHFHNQMEMVYVGISIKNLMACCIIFL